MNTKFIIIFIFISFILVINYTNYKKYTNFTTKLIFNNKKKNSDNKNLSDKNNIKDDNNSIEKVDNLNILDFIKKNSQIKLNKYIILIDIFLTKNLQKKINDLYLYQLLGEKIFYDSFYINDNKNNMLMLDIFNNNNLRICIEELKNITINKNLKILFENFSEEIKQINSIEEYYNLDENIKKEIIYKNYDIISDFYQLIDIDNFNYSRFIIFDIQNLNIYLYNQILLILLINCIYYSKPIIIMLKEELDNNDNKNIKDLQHILNTVKIKNLGHILYTNKLSNNDINQEIKNFLKKYNTFFK
jgi:hypothetical protein